MKRLVLWAQGTSVLELAPIALLLVAVLVALVWFIPRAARNPPVKPLVGYVERLGFQGRKGGVREYAQVRLPDGSSVWVRLPRGHGCTPGRPIQLLRPPGGGRVRVALEACS